MYFYRKKNMKNLLIIFLFFITNLYAFFNNPDAMLKDKKKFTEKIFADCDALEKSIDNLYIYDNVYFYDKEFHLYQYYYYRSFERSHLIQFDRTTGGGMQPEMKYGPLYIYYRDKNDWIFTVPSKGQGKYPLFYKSCIGNQLNFLNGITRYLSFSVNKLVFFQPNNDYIIPKKLRLGLTIHENINCKNLKEYIEVNSVNGSIYFVYLNTLYKAYLHFNGLLYMFVTENNGKNNYWSHDEGILNSLDGDFIYYGCVNNDLIFDNIKQKYRINLQMDYIKFVTLQVDNELVAPSSLQSSKYDTLAIHSCDEYKKHVTDDLNFVNNRLYFIQEDKFYFIENNFLFIYENNQWTMHSNNYSNPQCIDNWLLFDTIYDGKVSQKSLFDLHKLKFFRPTEPKWTSSFSGKPQWRRTTHSEGKEINNGQELKQFVGDSQRAHTLSDDKPTQSEEEGATAGLSLLSHRKSPNEETKDVSSEFEDKIDSLHATKTKSRHSSVIPQNTTAKNTELRQLNQNSEQTTGETEEQTTKF